MNHRLSVRLDGTVRVPGDKSITHRAVLFGSVALGKTRIVTNSLGRDNFASMRIMSQLGVAIRGKLSAAYFPVAIEEGIPDVRSHAEDFCEIEILGAGFANLKASSEKLYCGNSGTTARLLCGILAGRPFESCLNGDDSLSRRPFRRVVHPLQQMGARFSGEQLPLVIQGGALQGIDYRSPKSSAQIKTAILLAGLQASGAVSVTEPYVSRDHTERMFQAMGCDVNVELLESGENRVSLPASGMRELRATEFLVPGDFSSAAFFLVAASIIPGSSVRIINVGVNPTRVGLLGILQRMGAKIRLEHERVSGGEQIADIVVEASELQATQVGAEEVALAIDEIPILTVAAAFAQGTTEIRGAEELRVKESDRIQMMREVLADFGIAVEELPDGLRIVGNPDFGSQFKQPTTASGVGVWRTCHDHRIFMSAAILKLAVEGQWEVLNRAAIETSFPKFDEIFRGIIRPTETYNKSS